MYRSAAQDARMHGGAECTNIFDVFLVCSKKIPTDPGSTYPRPEKPPVYEGNPESYLYFGVPGVCSKGLLGFS